MNPVIFLGVQFCASVGQIEPSINKGQAEIDQIISDVVQKNLG